VYDYDPLGRRIAKSKLNKQGEKQCHTQFIWAGSHLVQEIRKGKNGAETDRTFTYIYTHSRWRSVTKKGIMPNIP